MIFEIIRGGEKTDWVGKEWAGLLFPWGKNGPAHSFPGEKADWGEIPACYTGLSTRNIAGQFRVNQTIIVRLLQRYQADGTESERQRSGRPL